MILSMIRLNGHDSNNFIAQIATMDRFEELLSFVTVADSGGFSAAGRRLGRSTAAVTRAVAALETRLGARLLHRTTRHVALSEAGARYLIDARRLLAELDEADRAAAGLHGSPQGTLVVTASALFGRLHVAPALLGLLAQHPQLQVQTLFVDRVVNLHEDGIDLAVRIGELPDSNLRAVPVGAVRLLTVAAPVYLAARGRPETVEALADHASIAFTGMASTREWRYGSSDGDGVRSVAIRPRLITSSAEVALDAAIAGLGLVRVLSYQAADALASGKLVPVLEAHEPPPRPVHVLHHEGRQVSAKVRAGFDHLVAALRENPAIGPASLREP